MFLVVLICCSVRGEFKEYEAKFYSPDEKLRVREKGGDYYLMSGNKWELIKSADTFGGEASPVIFMDANGDGYTDVFLKIYDGRVEGFYSLFLIRPGLGKLLFSEQKSIFGNPKADRHGFSSFEHDGPFVKVEEYRSHDGSIYKYLGREPLSADIERVTLYDSSGEVISASIRLLGSEELACARAVSAKVFFYVEPNEERKTQMYLAKGDLARVVDVTSDREWLKVDYAKFKAISGWLRSNQTVIEGGACKNIN
ncbi:hypothetical protein [Pseudomonas tohonis]|uniref:hypothetical protein n=1 Tax=Pseudomonas tohonis TaxID=2725477 RepID=UPI001F1C02EA|nr:hypothetical protein [Pseudomonas tohonis]